MSYLWSPHVSAQSRLRAGTAPRLVSRLSPGLYTCHHTLSSHALPPLGPVVTLHSSSCRASSPLAALLSTAGLLLLNEPMLSWQPLCSPVAFGSYQPLLPSRVKRFSVGVRHCPVPLSCSDGDDAPHLVQPPFCLFPFPTESLFI